MKIRRKLYLFPKILFGVVIVIFALSRMQQSESSHKLGIEVFVEAIAIFGIFIKSFLAYIFPEIILDKEGIKFIGRNKLKWSAVKFIRIRQRDSEINIVIEKYNSKKISEGIKDLNTTPKELEKEIMKFAPNILMVQDEIKL